jgi:hypothetical protein
MAGSRAVTRDIGVRMIGAADQAGVRQLAMEALPRPADGAPGPVRAVPPVAGGYLAQPDVRRLITTALSGIDSFVIDQSVTVTESEALLCATTGF